MLARSAIVRHNRVVEGFRKFYISGDYILNRQTTAAAPEVSARYPPVLFETRVSSKAKFKPASNLERLPADLLNVADISQSLKQGQRQCGCAVRLARKAGLERRVPGFGSPAGHR
jgi:hypothetical protein